MIILPLFIGFALWFCICGLVGGSILSCLWQDIKFAIPYYGPRYKGEFIKKRIDGFENGTMFGKKRSWSYKEIREKNLYIECGNDMLPGTLFFLTIHVFIPLAPLIIYLISIG